MKTMRTFYAANQLRLIFLYSVCGIAIFSLVATLQLSINGYTPQLKFYITPLIVGALCGAVVGLLQLRICRLLIKERQIVHLLQKKRKQTLAILEAMPDGLLVINSNGLIQLANQQAAQMLATTKEQLLGQKPTAVLPTTVDAASKTDGSLSIFEVKRKAAGNKAQTISVAIFPVPTNNVQDNTTIILLRDTSAEQRIEKMKTEFISNATHNLKTPITAITGYTELLLNQQEFSAEQTNEFLNCINENAWNLDKLVNNLLDINRAEAGRTINLNKRLQPVGELLEQFKAAYAPQQTINTVYFNLRDTAVMVAVDNLKMAQVLKHIIDNARKFSAKQQTITIDGKCAKGYYIISISDNGIGMTDKQCQHIFDKFYRVDDSDSGHRGFGLGLTLTKNIIEAHNGQVWVTSVLGEGTTLSFSLPIIDA